MGNSLHISVHLYGLLSSCCYKPCFVKLFEGVFFLRVTSNSSAEYVGYRFKTEISEISVDSVQKIFWNYKAMWEKSKRRNMVETLNFTSKWYLWCYHCPVCRCRCGEPPGRAMTLWLKYSAWGNAPSVPPGTSRKSSHDSGEYVSANHTLYLTEAVQYGLMYLRWAYFYQSLLVPEWSCKGWGATLQVSTFRQIISFVWLNLSRMSCHVLGVQVSTNRTLYLAEGVKAELPCLRWAHFCRSHLVPDWSCSCWVATSKVSKFLPITPCTWPKL